MKKRLLSFLLVLCVAATQFVSFSVSAEEEYTHFNYNFEDEELKISGNELHMKGWTPNGTQDLSYEDGVGVNGSTALKIHVTPKNENQSSTALEFKRAFMRRATNGDTVEVSVYIPENQKIKYLYIGTHTGDGYPQYNQSTPWIMNGDDYLETGKWYTVSMTIKDTTIWPPGNLTLGIGYAGECTVYVDECRIYGSTPTKEYEPYQGINSDTFDPKTAMEMVDEMNPGYNYGNTMEMSNEGVWNNLPVNREAIKQLKKEGFNSIRIPMMWGDHIGAAPDYKVDIEWMDRCERVVDWAMEEGFYVLINTHHDSGWIGSGLRSNDENVRTETINKLCKIWEQIADRFKYKSEKLHFEVMNEVGSGGNKDIITRVNFSVWETIRKSGGYNDKRVVVIGPEGYGLAYDCVVPDDPYIMVSYHDYGAWNNWKKDFWGSTAEREADDQAIQKVYESYVEKGIAVLVGEYGQYMPCKQANYKWYDHKISRLTEMGGIVHMLWDNGATNEGHMNYHDVRWYDPKCIEIIMNASNGIKNSFVEEDRIMVRSGDEERNQKVNLYLNGNKLVSISNGTNELVEGKDYTIDKNGTTVTLRGTAMKYILSGKDLGVITNLKFKFTEGADQEIPVYRYEQPVAEKTEVTIDPATVSEDVVVPVDPKGLSVVRISAKNVNGGYPFSTWSAFEGVQAKYQNNKLVVPVSQLKTLKEDVTYTFAFTGGEITVDLTIRVKSSQTSQEN